MAGFNRSIRALVHKDQSKVKYKLVNFHQTSTTYDTNNNPITTTESYRRLYNVAGSQKS